MFVSTVSIAYSNQEKLKGPHFKEINNNIF